jgi:hypothetical protein
VHPDRASAQALVDSYLRAARLRQLQAMLDHFNAEGRARELARADALTSSLARPGTTLGAHSSVASTTSVTLSGGKRENRASFTLTLALEEAGHVTPKTVTFEAVQRDDKWFLTDLYPGKSHQGSLFDTWSPDAEPAPPP